MLIYCIVYPLCNAINMQHNSLRDINSSLPMIYAAVMSTVNTTLVWLQVLIMRLIIMIRQCIQMDS